MQIIVSEGLAKYALADSVTIVTSIKEITTDEFSIGDLNSGNATIYAGVEDTPGDWRGNWYQYDGVSWVMTEEHPLYGQ